MATTLFQTVPEPRLPQGLLGPGTAILNGFAHEVEVELVSALKAIVERAPLRHMVTPGGFRMSVAMTNCGRFGWVTDRTGYRYNEIDPETGISWPSIPSVFLRLSTNAAHEAGFPLFSPDACLINSYEPGARLSLHQDKNERDFDQPIVSVSLGLPAIFQFGGLERSDKTIRIPVIHGDVIVWGGPARLRYHGVAPLKEGNHPLVGGYRHNLTFRKAG
jgi:alkylated DNA repair protein (DNA oxidative demethylase)